jgi:Mn-containing catalase
MYANVTAESTGRLLATRLYEMTDDPGMKDMLSFLIARDTMHQNQWLAVLEELGGVQGVHPIPNSFPQAQERSEVAYGFMSTLRTPEAAPDARWVQGRSIDGKGEFHSMRDFQPQGQEPKLYATEPRAHAQKEQMEAGGVVDGIKQKAKDIRS